MSCAQNIRKCEFFFIFGEPFQDYGSYNIVTRLIRLPEREHEERKTDALEHDLSKSDAKQGSIRRLQQRSYNESTSEVIRMPMPV